MAASGYLEQLKQAIAAMESELAVEEHKVQRLKDALKGIRDLVGVLESGQAGDGASAAAGRAVEVRRRRSGGARPSLNRRAGHFSYIEYDGRLFDGDAELLDHVGEPHYFSDRWEGPHIHPKTGQPCPDIRGTDRRHGHGDESERQILIWARRHPLDAKRVVLVQADGSRVSLWDFMVQMGWV